MVLCMLRADDTHCSLLALESTSVVSHCSVSLNGVSVMPSEDLYHYGAYFETSRTLTMRQMILRMGLCIETTETYCVDIRKPQPFRATRSRGFWANKAKFWKCALGYMVIISTCTNYCCLACSFILISQAAKIDFHLLGSQETRRPF